MKDQPSAFEQFHEMKEAFLTDLGVYRLLDWLEDMINKHWIHCMIAAWTIGMIVLITMFAALIFAS